MAEPLRWPDDDLPWPAPRANTELIGHGAAEAALLDAFRSGRMAHAWLFCGPPGIGKATLAYRFARFALSGGGGGLFGGGAPDLAPNLAPNLAMDADDPVFRRVAAGGHGDLLTVERSVDEKAKPKRFRDGIVVKDVDRVSPFLRLTAAEAGWRVVIVDCADELNLTAANTLLKPLEEPSGKSLIILVCHAPGRILPTIRSRCRTLTMKPLGEAAVRDILLRWQPDLDPVEAAAIARLADGSPGRALRLAEGGGLALYGEMLTLIGQAPVLDVEALHDMAGRITRGNKGPATFRMLMELLQRWLARLVRSAATGETPAEVMAGEGDTMRRLLACRDLEHWAEVWDKVCRLAVRADSANLDRKQVVINAFTTIEAAARP